ncbi:MAG: hypothetical protein WC783_03035 [Candidatus Paceibacterota bacterium]|jgi:hypothetical protein
MKKYKKEQINQYQKQLIGVLDDAIAMAKHDLNFCTPMKAFIEEYESRKVQVLKGKATDEKFKKWLENTADYYNPKDPGYAKYLRSLL